MEIYPLSNSYQTKIKVNWMGDWKFVDLIKWRSKATLPGGRQSISLSYQQPSDLIPFCVNCSSLYYWSIIWCLIAVLQYSLRSLIQKTTIKVLHTLKTPFQWPEVPFSDITIRGILCKIQQIAISQKWHVCDKNPKNFSFKYVPSPKT